MAMRRKQYRRRKAGGRAPRGRRTTQFYGRKIKQPVQYFTRNVYRPGFYQLTGGGAASGAGLNFQLTNLPNSSEFTSLYDQYQIKAVKVSLIPRHTEVNASTTVVQGNVWSVLDYDDTTAPVNVDQLLQYQNLKRTQMSKIHSRYLRPMVASEIFQSGIASGYAPRRKIWIDVASPATEHYGVKFWFDALPIGAATITYDVHLKFYLAFKNVR